VGSPELSMVCISPFTSKPLIVESNLCPGLPSVPAGTLRVLVSKIWTAASLAGLTVTWGPLPVPTVTIALIELTVIT
jgi:hypothetical protein